MNRHYTVEYYLEQIEDIVTRFDKPFLGSDIIAGFVGETDEEFETTVSNLWKSKLTQIHTFPYSIRKGTIAEKLKGHLPDRVKEERAGIIKKISAEKFDEYLKSNIGLVLEAVDALSVLGMTVSESAIAQGLESAAWPARFEIINHSPLIIFDGAHNPQGIASAVDSIEHYFADRKVAVITGVLRDKDYNFIANKLARVAAYAYTITPDNPRALTAGEYADVLRGCGVPATATESISEAVSLAVTKADKCGDAIVCLGSLYTYGEITAEIEKLGISKRR